MGEKLGVKVSNPNMLAVCAEAAGVGKYLPLEWAQCGAHAIAALELRVHCDARFVIKRHSITSTAWAVTLSCSFHSVGRGFFALV